MFKIHVRVGAIAVAAGIGFSTSGAAAQTYEFTIDPHASGLIANLGFDAQASGSLLGDWNEDTNPGGTRIRRGLVGGFGAGDNQAVPVGLGVSLAGDIETAAAGVFRLTLDADSGEISISGFAADLLASGPVEIPALMILEPESFRTRAPESVFAGIPVEHDGGSFGLRGLSIAQTAGPVLGTLTELEPGRFGFTLDAPAVLTAAIDLNGWPAEIAGPTRLTLAGEISVGGGSARLTALHTVDHAEVQGPAVALPQFSLDLPTLLPPGDTAHLLVDLTLDELGSSLIGRLGLTARGVVGGCLPDANGDGAVNTLDFLAYLRAWNSRAPGADLDGDGRVNSRDVLAFLSAWAAGC